MRSCASLQLRGSLCHPGLAQLCYRLCKLCLNCAFPVPTAPLPPPPPPRAVLMAFDLSPFHHAVDLGGATGAFMVQLAALHPHCRCTVVDLPHVVAAGTCARCRGGKGEAGRGGGQEGPPVVIAISLLNVSQKFPSISTIPFRPPPLCCSRAPLRAAPVPGAPGERAGAGVLVGCRFLQGI